MSDTPLNPTRYPTYPLFKSWNDDLITLSQTFGDATQDAELFPEQDEAVICVLDGAWGVGQRQKRGGSSVV